MSGINSISIGFTGIHRKTTKNPIKKTNVSQAKKLTPEQVFLEKIAGVQYALTHDIEDIKIRAIKEIFLGNMDFVDGMKEALAAYYGKKRL